MNLNSRAKTIKLQEINIGVNLHDFELGNDFVNMTPKEQETKVNID